MNGLAFSHISRAFGAVTALTDVSFDVTAGRSFGVIGRNGSGKSTLLKLLLGQLQPTSGNIKIGTRVEVAYFDQLREQLDEYISNLEAQIKEEESKPAPTAEQFIGLLLLCSW